MAENTKIQWCDATFNPWRGCTKVSPGCANCYAEAGSKRNPGVLGVWGPSGTRVVASEAMWREPIKWDKAAACICNSRLGTSHMEAFARCPQHGKGLRPRVFCASLADVFEDWEGQMVMPDGKWATINRHRGEFTGYHGVTLKGGSDALHMEHVRGRLLRLIHQTPNLDWLLLTKRPERWQASLEAVARLGGDAGDLAQQWLYGSPMPNVWLGTSVEDQQRADERIPHLLRTPAAVRFLSVEPLLGPIDLEPWLPGEVPDTYDSRVNKEVIGCSHPSDYEMSMWRKAADWVIVGGESGHNARPFDLEWARSIREQCRMANVAFFFKQMGENVVSYKGLSNVRFREKGGNLEDIPTDLRVREFPEVKS